MCPVLGGYTARIDYMSQIIFGIGQYKSRVIHSIILAGMRRFAGGSEVRSALGGGNGSLATGQTDKACVEIIQPVSQYGGAVPGGISGDKHHLDSLPDVRR